MCKVVDIVVKAALRGGLKESANPFNVFLLLLKTNAGFQSSPWEWKPVSNRKYCF